MYLTLLRIFLAILLGLLGYDLGGKIAHNAQVYFMGYEPFYLYSSMALVNNFVGGVSGAIICMTVLRNNKYKTMATMTLALLIIAISLYVNLSTTGWSNIWSYSASAVGIFITLLVVKSFSKITNGFNNAKNP